MKLVVDRIENNVGKGENAFSPFITMFSKGLKSQDSVVKGKQFTLSQGRLVSLFPFIVATCCPSERRPQSGQRPQKTINCYGG